MPMSKKHYAVIAAAILDQRTCLEAEEPDHYFVRIHLGKLTESLARSFSEDNPNFDATAFLKAAGYPMEEE